MANDNRYGGFGHDQDRDDYGRGYGAYGTSSQAGQVRGGTRDHDRDWDRGGRREERYRAYDRSGRDNERYRNWDEDRRVAIDETDRLIASNKVEGTRVYDRRGNRLGSIENFMVDKRSGKAEYAVLSFGGFLGIGERHYPLPWNQLTYDERMGGYVVDITERDLERAPSHRPSEQPRYDRGYGSDINNYYGL